GGGPAVPVVPLRAEPGSSPLPTACPHAALAPHGPSTRGPSLLPTPAPPASEGPRPGEVGVGVGARRRGPRPWGPQAAVPAEPFTLLVLEVLGRSRRSSLSGCQQCLSVTSSVLLSLFVSPIVTAVAVGVGVPLVLTYVYGVVVLSLCRSRGGGRGPPGDLAVVELENPTKLTELWSVLPSPRVGEDGVPDTTTSFPRSSRSPCRGSVCEEQDSRSASTVLSEGQDKPYRESVSIEVEVSIEAVPHPALELSPCSALLGQSLSGDSLGGPSGRGSAVGVPAD
ncbi:LOW QUALITY PROTEIN: uncharacterized protein VSU04_002015, partial [Chlamydotis macqueenii]